MTKLAPLVLICIVALAMLSGIGFVCSCPVIQLLETTLSKVNTEAEVFANNLNFEVLGDPIESPKPN